MQQEDWEFYVSYLNNKPASIAVDLAIAKVAPVATQPTLLWVNINFNQPRPDGLSSAEEFETLAAIEDALTEAITGSSDATYTGRVTTNGTRNLYFYVGETTGYEKLISETMADFPDYRYDYGTEADKDWNTYFDRLYPAPPQFQSIQNRKVVDELEENGDSLEKERPVDHWIFFRTETDRGAFLAKVLQEGFTVVTQDHDETFGGLPYRLHIRRTDKVDAISVDKYVLYLWQLAREHDGDYDGWETSIETG